MANRHLANTLRSNSQKKIVRIFTDLFRRHARWTVWSDFIMMAAISIANPFDRSNAQRRADTYRAISSKYDAREQVAFHEAFAELVEGMDSCTEQDFLGELYMALELGINRAGQFFTLYSICIAMAQMVSGDLMQQIERKGWVSVNDCACGAGALLIAYANECRRRDINYHTSVLFIAQDIDLISGCMCFIQLSLLGCPGYVVIGDSIANPTTSLDSGGLIPRHGPNVWYTPFYCTDVWHYRRLGAQMDLLLRGDGVDQDEHTEAI